ncbi:hypothetical protein N9W95_02330 [Paracoccaceae bacterium]|jgi:hypothetical protein|nr:hypothetical protein [Paracoccaceae bacterium]
MKHLNEVCKLLMDEADQRYELTKNKREAASLKSEADIAAIQKEHSRAAKEYLALPSRLSFLDG